jgi:hypothetical protein
VEKITSPPSNIIIVRSPITECRPWKTFHQGVHQARESLAQGASAADC